MCEAPPIKNIPRKSFRFKLSEFGHTAIFGDFVIHVGRNGAYWWWDVERFGSQICESDFTYKSDAKTKSIAIKRAVTQLNKWRKEHL